MPETSYKNVRLVSAPFNYLTLPSMEVAILSAWLKPLVHNTKVDLLDIDYACQIGGTAYEKAHQSVIGDAVFASILFPSHCPSIKKALASTDVKEDFESLREMTKRFVAKYLNELECQTDSKTLFIFPLFSKQFFPSLCISKEIYDRFGSKIWFSGFHCQKSCGKNVLELFPFVDQVFGNNPIREIVAQMTGQESPGYIKSLDDYPTPDYSDYQSAIDSTSPDFRENFIGHFWLQTPLSSGCSWNSCAFCTLNCQYNVFEQRSISLLLEDYKKLFDRHGTTRILASQFHSGKNWKAVIGSLDARFPGLKGRHEAYLKVSELQSETDIEFLKEHDVSVLVGVESFVQNGLRLMNKGYTPIEAVWMLKLMERYGVKCYYNLICSLPFENDDYFRASQDVIESILHLIPPFDLETFRLTHGSTMFGNPALYSISKASPRAEVEGMLMPEDILENYVPFFMDCQSNNEGIAEREDAWKKLIDRWRSIYYGFATEGHPKTESLLCKKWIEDLLEISDRRYRQGRCTTYVLRGLEKQLYEYCDSIRTIEEIELEFPELNSRLIEGLLEKFCETRIGFKEGARFISLAI